MGKKYEKNGKFTKLIGSPVVYMHDINSVPRFEGIINHVSSILRYDRVVAIARPKDIVFLKVQPDEGYLEWLKEVRLGTKKLIVLDGKKDEKIPERIMRHKCKKDLRELLKKGIKTTVISPFYGGTSEERVSKYLDIPIYANQKIVERYDSKINFKNLCRKIKLPTVEDAVFTANEGIERFEELVKKLIKETGKVIIRGEFGSSASTTTILDKIDQKALKKIIKSGKSSDRYLIEPFLKIKCSPSSIWFITDKGKIIHLRTSNQILSGYTTHEGNEFPGNYDEELLNKYSYKLAKEYAKEGFIGPFGFDFIETKNKAYATECNPRITGSLYPWALVSIMERDGKIKAARSQNIEIPKKGMSFNELRKIWDDLLYDGKKNTGVVVPFNVGPLIDGKITVLVTGKSKKEVNSIIKKLYRRLKNAK